MQTIEAARDNDALLRLSTVIELTGMSRSELYRRIASGTFVAPVKLGPRCARWPAGRVRAWLSDKAAA